MKNLLTKISLPLLCFVLVGCQTARHTGHRRAAKPDMVPASIVAELRDSVANMRAWAEAQSEAATTMKRQLSLARVNINKVYRAQPGSWQRALQDHLDELTADTLFTTTQLGLCVYDLTDDSLLCAVNIDQRMRPASNEKLVSAIAGLDILGADYRFTPTVPVPGWGWCWDDSETGMRDFNAQGTRQSSSILYQEASERSLANLLVPMMKKSDNMLAESVFYQLALKRKADTGATQLGRPSGRGEAVAMVDSVFRKADIAPATYTVADGSGVSLYNYLTPRLLVSLLRYAYSQPAIYDVLLPSLPIAGIDGTLQKRMQGTTAQGNIYAKTGTVTGVSCLSGYCTTASGHRLCFSIMNQGLPRATLGRDFQDRVCCALTAPF